MLSRMLICALWLLLAAPAAGAQTAQPQPAPVSPAPRPIPTVALGEVAVRVQPRRLTLRAPGQAQGLQDAFAQSLTPTRRVAVWLPTPDSARSYRIRAVRVRLGAGLPDNLTDFIRRQRRFHEGRLALHLSSATASGAPADADLLSAPLLLTPAASARHERGWLRFDVAEQHLIIPAAGVFIVAEGLTTSPDEQFVKHRSLLRRPDGRQPLEDYDSKKTTSNGKGTQVFLYEEIQPAGGGPTRLVPSDEFPALAHRTVGTAADCRSWRWQQGPSRSGWIAMGAETAVLRQRSAAFAGLKDFNYNLELEVEEL